MLLDDLERLDPGEQAPGGGGSSLAEGRFFDNRWTGHERIGALSGPAFLRSPLLEWPRSGPAFGLRADGFGSFLAGSYPKRMFCTTIPRPGALDKGPSAVRSGAPYSFATAT